MEELRVAIAGATGRMGKTLIRIIDGTPGICLTGAITRQGSSKTGQDAGEESGIQNLGVPVTDDPLFALKNAHGIIDFSTPDSAVELCSLAEKLGIFDVIAVTGCTPQQEEKIQSTSSSIAVLKSSNMSPSMNFLSALIEKAAFVLSASDFDVEILEMHHRNKVDAPSGSALMLAESVSRGRSTELSSTRIPAREGKIPPRAISGIGFASLRGGEIAGEHSVIFAGEHEKIVFSHHSYDRSIFAQGAIQAALWLRNKKPGFYTMHDVINFSNGWN